MNITIINDTEQKGCTFAMKDMFLSAMGSNHNITEYFLPRDCPVDFKKAVKIFCFANIR